MRIDTTPSHPMQPRGRVDESSINAAALETESATPQELAIKMLRVSGRVRRGEVIDGAQLVALLKSAAGFLNEDADGIHRDHAALAHETACQAQRRLDGGNR